MDIRAILANIQEAKQNPNVSPYQYARIRETALIDALCTMASDFKVSLLKPTQIDSNGELSVISVYLDEAGNPKPSNYFGCAAYGPEFASILSKYSPRTGYAPASSIDESNGWCYMNHFDVERMVSDYANQLSS